MMDVKQNRVQAELQAGTAAQGNLKNEHRHVIWSYFVAFGSNDELI